MSVISMKQLLEVNHRAFGVHSRITGNGKRILCREGKTQVSTPISAFNSDAEREG